jgi:hypothetical protein
MRSAERKGEGEREIGQEGKRGAGRPREGRRYFYESG